MLPRTVLGVRINAAADEENVVGPNSVIFYRIGDRPAIRWIDTVDRSDFVVLRPDLYEEATGQSYDSPQFARRVVDISPRLGFSFRSLSARLSLANNVESLEVGETLLVLVSSAAALTGRDQHHGRSIATDSQRRMIDRTRELIATNPAANSDLQCLASEVGASPAHLARTFRRHVGSTIHDFRTFLRLQLSLDQLDDDLTTVAHRLGFSSHSHFTDRFRRLYGVTPRDARRLLRGQLADRTDPRWTAV